MWNFMECCNMLHSRLFVGPLKSANIAWLYPVGFINVSLLKALKSEQNPLPVCLGIAQNNFEIRALQMKKLFQSRNFFLNRVDNLSNLASTTSVPPQEQSEKQENCVKTACISLVCALTRFLIKVQFPHSLHSSILRIIAMVNESTDLKSHLQRLKIRCLKMFQF